MSADTLTTPSPSSTPGPAPAGAATSRPVIRWVLGQQARGTLGWSVALAALSAMYIAFWPAIDGSDLTSFVDNLPEDLSTALGYDQIGTAAGYLSSSVFGLLIPALLMVHAVMRGAALVAGEEEQGTLELELTAPVPRTAVARGRLVALLTSLAVIAAAITAVSILMVALLDIEVAAGNIAATGLGLALLAMAVGTVALASGAATGRRTIGLAAGAGVAAGGFMLNAIGPTIGAGWMTAISPFSWYIGEDPLRTGVDPVGFGLLLALVLLAAAIGEQRFRHRDLQV